MFKCEKCGNDSALSERPVKVVIATRKKEYVPFQRPNGTHDTGGVGHEIVREVGVHESCAMEVRAMVAAAEAAEAAARAQHAASAVIYASDSARDSTPFNGAHVS